MMGEITGQTAPSFKAGLPPLVRACASARLSHYCCARIVEIAARASEYRIPRSDFVGGEVVVQHRETGRERVVTLRQAALSSGSGAIWTCACGQDVGWRMLCVHVMMVLLEMAPNQPLFDRRYFGARWFLETKAPALLTLRGKAAPAFGAGQNAHCEAAQMTWCPSSSADQYAPWSWCRRTNASSMTMLMVRAYCALRCAALRYPAGRGVWSVAQCS